jgi:hypothetical protein
LQTYWPSCPARAPRPDGTSHTDRQSLRYVPNITLVSYNSTSQFCDCTKHGVGARSVPLQDRHQQCKVPQSYCSVQRRMIRRHAFQDSYSDGLLQVPLLAQAEGGCSTRGCEHTGAVPVSQVVAHVLATGPVVVVVALAMYLLQATSHISAWHSTVKSRATTRGRVRPDYVFNDHRVHWGTGDAGGGKGKQTCRKQHFCTASGPKGHVSVPV